MLNYSFPTKYVYTKYIMSCCIEVLFALHRESLNTSQNGSTAWGKCNPPQCETKAWKLLNMFTVLVCTYRLCTKTSHHWQTLCCGFWPFLHGAQYILLGGCVCLLENPVIDVWFQYSQKSIMRQLLNLIFFKNSEKFVINAKSIPVKNFTLCCYGCSLKWIPMWAAR